MSELKLRRRILGIDLGTARIGVAVSDELGMLAHPVETIPAGSGAALAFAKKLEAILPCQVVTWDERLTTTAANRALRASGRKTRNSRHVVDQVAAQMILQGYLDSLQTDEISPGS
jgi:putative Holliday junction resolvase